MKLIIKINYLKLLLIGILFINSITCYVNNLPNLFNLINKPFILKIHDKNCACRKEQPLPNFETTQNAQSNFYFCSCNTDVDLKQQQQELQNNLNNFTPLNNQQNNCQCKMSSTLLPFQNSQKRWRRNLNNFANFMPNSGTSQWGCSCNNNNNFQNQYKNNQPQNYQPQNNQYQNNQYQNYQLQNYQSNLPKDNCLCFNIDLLITEATNNQITSTVQPNYSNENNMKCFCNLIIPTNNVKPNLDCKNPISDNKSLCPNENVQDTVPCLMLQITPNNENMLNNKPNQFCACQKNYTPCLDFKCCPINV